MPKTAFTKTARKQRTKPRKYVKKGERIRYRSFPPKYKASQKGFYKLTYAQTVSLTTSTTYSAEHLFRLNSLYDPDLTGVGHQPYGHDELSNLWTRYKVHKVKAEILTHDNSAHAGYTFYMRAGDGIADSSTTTSVYLIESEQAEKTYEVPPLHTASGQGIQRKYKRSFYVDKYKNQGKEETNYNANFGANPSDSIMFAIGQCSDDLTSHTVTAHVKLTYYFETREPKLVAQS